MAESWHKVLPPGLRPGGRPVNESVGLDTDPVWLNINYPKGTNTLQVARGVRGDTGPMGADWREQLVDEAARSRAEHNNSLRAIDARQLRTAVRRQSAQDPELRATLRKLRERVRDIDRARSADPVVPSPIGGFVASSPTIPSDDKADDDWRKFVTTEVITTTAKGPCTCVRAHVYARARVCGRPVAARRPAPRRAEAAARGVGVPPRRLCGEGAARRDSRTALRLRGAGDHVGLPDPNPGPRCHAQAVGATARVAARAAAIVRHPPNQSKIDNQLHFGSTATGHSDYRANFQHGRPFGGLSFSREYLKLANLAPDSGRSARAREREARRQRRARERERTTCVRGLYRSVEAPAPAPPPPPEGGSRAAARRSLSQASYTLEQFPARMRAAPSAERLLLTHADVHRGVNRSLANTF